MRLYARIILVLSLLCTTDLFAQQFVVVNTTEAKFAWDFQVPLQTGESWRLTCTPQPTGTPIVKQNVTMPYRLADALTADGRYACVVHFVAANGTVGSASNTITVTIKGARLVLEVP